MSGIKRIIFLLGALFLALYSHASHVLGGEITYRYLDNNGPSGNPFRYEITIRIYNNRDGQVPDGIETGFGYAIYNASDGSIVEYRTPANNITYLNPDIPPGCVVPGVSNFRITLNEFVDIVNLPFSPTGFDVIWERGTRIANIANILQGGGGVGSTFHAFIPSSIYNNSSPQFTDRPIPAMCTIDTTTFINNAYDPDGDQLVYRFVAGYVMNNWGGGNGFAPYNQPENAGIYSNYSFPANLTYANGFSAAQPFGTTNGYSFINSSTGLTQYYTTTSGNYVVNVDIDEYRDIGGNSVLISTTRRELQIFVGNCAANNQPIITSLENSNSSFVNIFEGDSVQLTIQTTDPELNTVTIETSGAIFDSTTFAGPTATFTLDSTTGEGVFNWATTCGLIGSYQFVVSARDDGCPPKTSYQIYTINVLPFEAAGIIGPDSVCYVDQNTLFRVNQVRSGSQFQWNVINGSISAYSNDSSRIWVNWNSSGNGRVELYEISKEGCVDSTFKLIRLKDAEIIQAQGDTTICSGDTTLVEALGGGTFSWSPAQLTTDSTAASTMVFPDTTTNFIVGSLTNSCFLPDTVEIKVNRVESTIPSDTTCQRDSLLVGNTMIAGYSYAWESNPSINDTAIAQPFVWVDSSGTFEFSVQITDTNNCSIYDTATIFVRAAPDAIEVIGGNSVCPDVTGIDYYTPDTTIVGFNWTISGGALVSGQSTDSIVVDWGAANDDSYVGILATDIYGCVGDTSKYPVLINAILQTETPNGLDTLCFFDIDSLQYSITKINGSTYTWTVSGGLLNSGQGTQEVNVSWLGDTIAYLFIEEAVNTSSSVCLGQSDTLWVTINPSPDTTLNIIGANNICAFSENENYAIAGLDSSSFIWTLDTGGIIANGQGSNTVQINWDSTGTYPITVIETTEFGCVGRSISDTINVRSIPNTITSNGKYFDAVCPPNFSKTYNVIGLDDSSSYHWNVIGADSVILNSTTAQVIWDSSFDPKSIYVIEESQYGCIGDTLRIKIAYDPSRAIFTSVSDNFLDEKLIDITWSSVINGDSLTSDLWLYRKQILPTTGAWDFITTISKNENTYSDGPFNTKEEGFQYLLSTSNLCLDTVTTLVHNNVVLNVSGNEEDGTTTLSWNHYNDWSNFGGVQEYNVYRNLDDQGYALFQSEVGLDSAVSYNNAGDGFTHCYRLEAIQSSNNDVVSWSNEVCVTYIHDLHVYNAVTPNGDGDNEVFYVRNIWLYPDNDVEIYNRWGNRVYRKEGYNNEWNGGNLPDGTYYYIVNVRRDGEGRLFKGNLLLQR